jgi:R3H-associated N-terminal domain
LVVFNVFFQIWEKFMRLSESQQRRFLMQIADNFDRASRQIVGNGKSATYFYFTNSCLRRKKENFWLTEDQPTSPDDCFRRIDSQLRHLIAHRSPPVVSLSLFFSNFS